MRERFLLDLRYALRHLRRNPGFAVVALTVLAVGIGANTASFGLVDALLLKPLPVRAPDELVRVASTGVDGAVSFPDYLDYSAGASSLSGLMAFTADTLRLRVDGHGENERVAAYLVSDNYFDVLGVSLAHGRVQRRPAAPGEPPGVVLSYDFWERRFAADPGVLGRPIWLGGSSFVVAGVAPRRFTGTMRGGGPNLFVPYTSVTPPAELLARGRRNLIAVGRLAQGVSLGAAQAELAVVARRLEAAYPEADRGVTVTLGPEATALFREVPQLAYLVTAVFALFGLFLMVACLNLACLLTARATLRQKEIAIRLMQGASRKAILSQLLTENLVLALLGGLGGVVAGALARHFLWGRLQSAITTQLGLQVLWIDPWIDARTLIFTTAISGAAMLAFGLMPALQASKQDLYGRAKDDPASPPPRQMARLRRLVAAQVMLSVVLLVGAGLLLQAVRKAASTDLGYPLDRTYVASLDVSGGDRERVLSDLDVLLDRVRAMVGVETAALGGDVGPGYLPWSMTPGRTSRQNYVLAASGPRFFDTLRIPILSGRDFDERDTRGSAAVAIVNQRLAQTLWPGQDPVGRQLKLSDGKPPLTVVGLAKTVRSFPIGPPFFQIYVPFTQFEVAGIALYVRSAHGQEEGVRNQLSEELRGSLPGAAVLRVQALTERVGSVLAIPQALAAVLGLLGGAALFLATVGLYGVTAYIAGRRARECAVRRVCGASRLSILSLVLRDAMRTILIGVGAGLALSLVVGWLLKHAVLGAAFDPIALVVAPTVLASTALAAVAWPVFRATSVDPMLVLRED